MPNTQSDTPLCEVCLKKLLPKTNGKYNRTCGGDCHIKLRTKNTARTMRVNGTYDRLGAEHKLRMSCANMRQKHSLGITNSLNTLGKDGLLPKEKAAKSLSITLKNNPEISEKREPKRRATMEKNGRWIPIDQQPEAVAYRLKVHSITMSQPLYLLENFEKRGPSTSTPSDNHHIDHIFSVMDGFHQNVSPEIVGNFCNLRMLHHRENVKKNSKSDITKEELLRRYNLALCDKQSR